jgi:phosphoserine phosphatase
LNLVVQSPDEGAAAKAADLATLVGAHAPEPLGPRAWRLRGAQPREDIATWCAARRLDHAWVPEGRRFADLRLVAMDMDSTLITIECIDELAAHAGKKPEVAAITELTMQGRLDYRESVRQRVSLLAGLDEDALQEVYDEQLRLSPGADALLEGCRRHGVKTLLVSGGFAFFTERLKARLGLDETLSNVLEVDGGRLTGRILGLVVDAEAKAARFRQFAQRLGAARAQTVAIGDGANDLRMMAEAGVSVGYHPKPIMRAQVSHCIDFCGLDAVLHLFEHSLVEDSR